MSGGVARNEDNVNSFGVALVGIAAAIVLWASVVALQAYYKDSTEGIDAERAAANASDAMRTLRSEQQAALQGARIQGEGFASMPIKQAMIKVVADENANNPVLVPLVDNHNTPTVPATPGKPKEGAAVPAQPEPAADGAEAAGAAADKEAKSGSKSRQDADATGNAKKKSSSDTGKAKKSGNGGKGQKSGSGKGKGKDSGKRSGKNER